MNRDHHDKAGTSDVKQFTAEMNAFSQAVQCDGSVKTPGELGLADMRIILAVLESIRREGEPVRIGESTG